MARRLAAIVAVDIVGWSRLMAIDEDETWAAWSELRSIINPAFETDGGRVVKSTGDGVLVESPSVIQAVNAAIRVQQLSAEWNDRRPPDRALRLRIGVNLGDVIVAEDGDVYGDGVNVAARLEGLADPGGVCISDSAYQQVRGRVDARFVDRGEQWVKNIPTPVRVWALLGDATGAEIDVGVSGLEHAEVVGRGGNATVYRAYQRAMDRWVAVKVLDGSDEATRRRFDRERQAMGRLSQHPGIVTIYESGYTLEGRPYLVMPFLGSGSLRDRLDRAGPMPWAEAAEIIAQVAKAVDHAHRSEIVHRDLKPGNIMLDDEGRPLVADFGIARLADQAATVTDRLALTPAYSPPELLDGAEPTAAGDIYGLAATFCALVSGSPPFVTGSPDTDTLLALSRRIASDPPPDLSGLGVPAGANRAVAAAMAKEPELRPPSARAFADQLLGIAAVDERRIVPAGGDSPSSDEHRFVNARMKRLVPLGIGAILVVTSAVVVAGLRGDGATDDTTTTVAAETSTTRGETTTSVTDDQVADAEWTVTFDAPIVSVAVDQEGTCSPGAPCSAPVVVTLEDGTLHSIDARSGDSLWPEPFDAGFRSGAFASSWSNELVITENRIYFVRPGSKLIFEVDLASGTVADRVLSPFDNAQGDPGIDEGGGSLYVGFGQGVARLGAGGWDNATVARSPIERVSVDGRILVVADGRTVYCVDAADGTDLWEIGPPRIDTPVWVLAQEIEVESAGGRDFDRRVFVETESGSGRDLVLLDGEQDGEQDPVRWTYAISWRPGSPPDDTVYLGGVDGELVALDAGSGEPIWPESLDLRIDGPPVVSEGTVYVVVDSEIVAVNARSGNERGRIDLPGLPTAHIRAVGDLVIVAIEDTLLGVRLSR